MEVLWWVVPVGTWTQGISVMSSTRNEAAHWCLEGCAVSEGGLKQSSTEFYGSNYTSDLMLWLIVSNSF